MFYRMSSSAVESTAWGGGALPFTSSLQKAAGQTLERETVG